MRLAARPWAARPVLALPAALALSLVAVEARADARQASLGVKVNVVGICVANSALGPVAGALAAECLSTGATVALEQPAATDGPPGGAPMMQERAPAEEGLSYVTVIY